MDPLSDFPRTSVQALDQSLLQFLGRHSDGPNRLKLPLVVGFGISDPAQAGQIAKVADGVVVGSALVKYFEKYRGAELVKEVGSFAASLKAGVVAGRQA